VESGGIGPGFADVDATTAPAELIEYLDRARRAGGPIALAKQWISDQLRLASGQAVLDVGCGTGDDVAAMAAVVGPTGRAVGVDSSEAMISEACSRHGGLPGVSFELGDAQRLPFESESFDGCRAERVLQHVLDPARVVGEMARVLKGGGRLAVMDADWEGLLIEGSDPALSGAIWRNYLAGARQPRVGRRLRTLLMQSGFVNIQLEAAAGLVTDLDLAARQFDFARASTEAATAGVVSQHEAVRWLDELQDAARDGRFLCSVLSFRAVGQKP
jgi:ubiquinone/menaquinone biosynthesis C-methylase UbiE